MHVALVDWIATAYHRVFALRRRPRQARTTPCIVSARTSTAWRRHCLDSGTVAASGMADAGRALASRRDRAYRRQNADLGGHGGRDLRSGAPGAARSPRCRSAIAFVSRADKFLATIVFSGARRRDRRARSTPR